jgi:hypothetical protein
MQTFEPWSLVDTHWQPLAAQSSTQLQCAVLHCKPATCLITFLPALCRPHAAGKLLFSDSDWLQLLARVTSTSMPLITEDRAALVAGLPGQLPPSCPYTAVTQSRRVLAVPSMLCCAYDAPGSTNHSLPSLHVFPVVNWGVGHHRLLWALLAATAPLPHTFCSFPPVMLPFHFLSLSPLTPSRCTSRPVLQACSTCCSTFWCGMHGCAQHWPTYRPGALLYQHCPAPLHCLCSAAAMDWLPGPCFASRGHHWKCLPLPPRKHAVSSTCFVSSPAAHLRSLAAGWQPSAAAAGCVCPPTFALLRPR